MQNLHNAATNAIPTSENSEYIAPAIETVLSPDDLEREVFYAGAPTSVPPIPG